MRVCLYACVCAYVFECVCERERACVCACVLVAWRLATSCSLGLLAAHPRLTGRRGGEDGWQSCPPGGRCPGCQTPPISDIRLVLSGTGCHVQLPLTVGVMLLCTQHIDEIIITQLLSSIYIRSLRLSSLEELS